MLEEDNLLIYKHQMKTNKTNLERHWHSLFILRWLINQTASFTKNQERPIACVRIPIWWSSLCLTNKDWEEGYLSAYLLWSCAFSSLWQTKRLNALSIVSILFVLKWESPFSRKMRETTVMPTKMAIILPTGQWYAPSAVINDAWYCMVLHCIA